MDRGNTWRENADNLSTTIERDRLKQPGVSCQMNKKKPTLSSAKVTLLDPREPILTAIRRQFSSKEGRRARPPPQTLGLEAACCR